MKITIPAFDHEKDIPAKYTCNGENVNPAIKIEDIPEEAKCLAVVVEDPDAPGGTFYHWVMWNVPLQNEIKENSSPGIEGIHGFKKRGYTGPCPPSGTHRYYFKVFGLDEMLDIDTSTTGDQFLEMIENKIVGFDEWMGSYSKQD